MTCKDCTNVYCELKGTGITIPKEKCEQIDMLMRGETPQGWTEKGGVF